MQWNQLVLGAARKVGAGGQHGFGAFKAEARADDRIRPAAWSLRAMQKQLRKEKSFAAKDRKPHHGFDLRTALDWLRSQGDLIETDKEVDPDLEVTGLQKHMDGGCPVLFNKVKGKPHHRVVTNLFGDMKVINKMFGWKDDAELTVGSGIRCVTGPQFDGGSDLGYNRMNFRWGNVGTFQISPGSHMWQVVNKFYKANEPVPITMCFGVPPACTLLAGAGFDYAVLPMGCDEIGVAGAVQGAPIRLVKARTVDAMALADAELVLEGYVKPRDRRFETKESEDA